MEPSVESLYFPELSRGIGKEYTEPSIGASHQLSVHLAKQLQRRRFLEIDQPETRIACDQMNQNLVGSILGMSSINNAHLVPIR
jgi:hypothetical protein